MKFTPEQQAERRKGIGASEAAAALGVCPWKSRFQLWAEKTGKADPPDLDAVEAVEWGDILEAVICETFAKRTGRRVHHNEGQAMEHHSKHDFMFATPDATQMDKSPRPEIGVLQIKTTSLWRGDAWAEDARLPYRVQVQHEMACTGRKWGTLVCLIGGQKMVHFDQERNQKFIDAMIEEEAKFWELVTSDTPPEPDGSAATTEVLRRLYPLDDGEIIALPAESAEWDELLVEMKLAIKQLNFEKNELQNKLKAAMGTATTGVLPSGGQYTFKSQTVNHEAREAFQSSHRVLRRKA